MGEPADSPNSQRWRKLAREFLESLGLYAPDIPEGRLLARRLAHLLAREYGRGAQDGFDRSLP